MMKEAPCEKCNGYGFISHFSSGDGYANMWSEFCAECNGTGKISVPETIADRIRDMNEEELANVLLDWFCIGNRECYTRNREEVRNEILQWLQSSPLV